MTPSFKRLIPALAFVLPAVVVASSPVLAAGPTKPKAHHAAVHKVSSHKASQHKKTTNPTAS